MSGDVLTSFTVYGVIAAPAFQQCTDAAAYVNRTYPESYAVSIQRDVPRDFDERRAQWIAAGQLATDEHARSDVLVHNVATNAFMTAAEFLALVMLTTHYRADPSTDNAESYRARAQQSWLDFLAARDRQYCWMDVTVDDVAVGRVWFELFSAVAPLTCKNFCELCRGTSVEVTLPSASTSAAAEAGSADQAAGTRTLLTYKGTTFFRILKDAWVMAGDVTAGHSGNGGYSCYGRTFPDESFAVAHDAAGVLGMCNDGPHTNSSSFYITRRPLSWMDRKYVAFGRVMDGMSVVDAIHAVGVKHNQSPLATIVIADCGVLDPSE
ncbi:cyclophilin 12 putative (CYP12) [Leptomonas pyrrhocoris]|uniref:Cyclophilin 12 putative (CYP12) n=1 Tax=Leptomonas pyrrhocoris TaxID=157538 RepID=A0A0M9FPW8_LEPPY|nr:cyclophilin 12 putative (CYP12) [Leptomonas pyrrhocoris]XP_015652104.1 cyclophilin 12 putative (CYP12) [Leptomonas pyrrhocoris]KPA73664.1 cyclophilin 12 putative (CYP12) [Leptomonas pyrrhocoris]KPA73665.1 cyclophilin 12 putative (CYP12) [Leptomonas pyrrhocoris]|eukprot:XP_015652103.1 cyclophilin 12 putative (CYP12) [Leptomonas pyrrhocoris]